LDRAREDGYFGRLASAWAPIIKCHIGTEMIDVGSYIAAKDNKWGLWMRKLVYCYSADVDLDFLRNNWKEFPRRRRRRGCRCDAANAITRGPARDQGNANPPRS
jgi:hypothetical protein